MNERKFFVELKRRDVIRFAGLYLVGAWLLTQVASTASMQTDNFFAELKRRNL